VLQAAETMNDLARLHHMARFRGVARKPSTQNTLCR